MEDIICVSPKMKLTQPLSKRVYVYKTESQNGYNCKERVKSEKEWKMIRSACKMKQINK